LQAEILWLLCGEADQSEPWTARKLRRGSLFLVGDPKQAIYRFRGADVDTYLEAKRALLAQDPGSIIEITANFRSRAPILAFANDRFQPLLSEAAGQPGFTPLAAIRPASADGPAVACFEVPIDDRHKDDSGKLNGDLVREHEAGIVAEIVQRLIGNYQIWDKQRQTMRVCRAGDIALLAPTGASLWRYERALEYRHVPVASQAGKGFFRRQEVQDLIAVARAVADRRDTLAFGALLRGPLVGLSEEEIADAIAALPARQDGPRLHLWTDRTTITHPILSRTLEVLQNLARKARTTTPYQILAEGVEELNIRPILRSRYRLAPERALANAELFLEMARAYDGRGLSAFALAMRGNWDDTEAQVEGRPDAEAHSVPIMTMHLAKGLEWPIVIPINSPTELYDDASFLHRRRDDTVHFKILDQAPADYDQVKADEKEQLRRERVRLWYVAITRAGDLLLLPRQSERKANDWMSIVDLKLDDLPAFDHRAIVYAPEFPEIATPENTQEETTWRSEAAAIAAIRQSIVWRSPSRHEMPPGAAPPSDRDKIFADAAAFSEQLPFAPDTATVAGAIRGSRERGLVVHKLLEEVLTGETADRADALEVRARALLDHLGITEAARPEDGPHPPELAATTLRALAVPEIVACRSRLLPELSVFSSQADDNRTIYVGGIADAVAYQPTGVIDLVVDWKTDVSPSAQQIDLYREQMHDYLVATGAPQGLLVFVTTGQLVRVRPNRHLAATTASGDSRVTLAAVP
jgi:ATP-dependent exoDNAse (exonuclease V) beta subunit